MKEKSARQSKIAQIIKEQSIGTQDELLKYLKQKGTRVTQATLSRDIKEMGVLQVPGTSGRHYQLNPGATGPATRAELTRRFGGYLTDIKSAGNLIVVKTLPGEASGTARLVDGLNLPEVLGTIAGDDTFLIIVKDKQSLKKVLEKIKT
ncbi:MAG: arginine repressor [Candidatus Brocadiia bacterium]